MLRIGIMVVAYNATSTVSSVLDRIPAHVWDEVEEVAVFDDASHDDTHASAVAFAESQRLDKIVVHRHEQNLGYGGNQRHGYEYFADKDFDIVVLLHGDGQYAPEVLDHLYRPIVEGHADAVFGSRIMPDFGGALHGGMPLYKFVGNRILTKVENHLLGMRLTEFHSGYRAYRVSALRAIDMSSMTSDFHFDTEIIVKLHHQGFRIAEVPIPTYYGDEISYVNGMRYAKDVVRSVLRYRRAVNGSAAPDEYAEYVPRYPARFADGTSHAYAVSRVGSGKRVLDVGCGDGHVAARLVANGNTVVGIDGIDDPAELDALEHYVRADLDRGLDDVLDWLPGDGFDTVLLLDVLEHLADPLSLLRRCTRVLRPGGELVISVPNVANLTVRAGLAAGRFQYQERGILDRDHLRFFTRRTLDDLLTAARLRGVWSVSTVMPVDVALTLDPDRGPARALRRVLAPLTAAAPNVLGYQHLVAAVPA